MFIKHRFYIQGYKLDHWSKALCTVFSFEVYPAIIIRSTQHLLMSIIPREDSLDGCLKQGRHLLWLLDNDIATLFTSNSEN